MVFSGSGRHRRPTQTDRAVAAASVAGVGLALPLLTAAGAHAAPVTAWQTVAHCASGGNWASNDGEGGYGGLQISLKDWSRYGGDQYAAQPDHATEAQQIAVAEQILTAKGPGLWDSCGSALTTAPATPTPPTAPTTPVTPTTPTAPATATPDPVATVPGGTPTTPTSPVTPVTPPTAVTPAAPATTPTPAPTATTQPTTGQPATAQPSTPQPPAAQPGTPQPTASQSTGDQPTPAPTATTQPTTPTGQTAEAPQPAPAAPAAPATPAPAAPQDYTVLPGDTLSDISNTYHLGGWQHVYDHNQTTVGTDPNLIHPGQVLHLGS
ncbi:hypothetical protein CFP65_0580 [Kitasatospora sp. MMS16-BH015]|uniref:LysM peptidoglycan-binding domain-containing protein n=1 Tax=Kitasatospora sp. MMS16-BH015 TaxID=2018025 RepID=UPI000CA21357|nr:transglycosylase family protein [Kitasatospora sp. MMS16-BH015]AUG75540.1 hypothetical protein CFP65_0580 [Kitasatospora sp. MMS16-BH015]